MSDIKSIITEKLKLGKPKLAFGLAGRFPEVEESIKKNLDIADIVIVSREEIPGFKTIVSEKPEEKIIDMLLDGEVDGIIRGTVDDFSALYYLCNKINMDRNDVATVSIIESPNGHVFALSAVNNPRGWDLEDRKKNVKNTAEFLKKIGIEPQIGIFTGVRPESVGKNPKMDSTWYMAEELVKYITGLGYNAKNYNIELNVAIKSGVNLVDPVNGMVGNQILRAILLCGGRLLCGPRINVGYVYEDNSRTERIMSGI